MAREYAQIRLAIGEDDNFRSLSAGAGYLYLQLLINPTLSYVGVLDWRPTRIAARANHNWTVTDTLVAAHELAAKQYIVIDEATEEALIRSYLRNDGLMARPRMAVAAHSAFRTVISSTIRGVLVHEVIRLHADQPELGGWKRPAAKTFNGDPGPNPIAELLEREPLSPEAVAQHLPDLCPMVAEAFAANVSKGLPVGYLPPTPSTLLLAPSNKELNAASARDVPDDQAATAPPPPASKKAKKKPSTTLPERWEPNATHQTFAVANGLNLVAEVRDFRDHAAANDRRQADWDAAFRMWLTKAVEFGRGGERTKPARQLPTVADLEQPPDGLSPEECAAWERERLERRQA